MFRNLAESNKNRLVQVYKEAPKLFDAERALICNQSWAKLPSAPIATIEQAMNPTIPTIAAMKKYTPEGVLVDLVEAILIETILAINVKRNMTEAQIRSTAFDIAHHPEFYYLSISEITFIMRKGRNGEYNQDGLFNAVGPNDIIGWIKTYTKERLLHIEEKQKQEALYHKTAMEKGSEWSKENLIRYKNILLFVKTRKPRRNRRRKYMAFRKAQRSEAKICKFIFRNNKLSKKTFIPKSESQIKTERKAIQRVFMRQYKDYLDLYEQH